MPNFVHLHGHTEYSLLDGLSKIPKLTKAAKDLGMDALAITDHGVMYGAIEFYKACVDVGIKPIIGCELYVAPRSHKSKEGKVDTDPYHLTILAKNYQGYLNLMKLVTISHLEGFYYRPRVDKELLKQFHEGLICLSGCPGGEFIKSLDDKNPKKAEDVARSYLEIFGEGNYFLEIQNHFYEQLLTPGMEPIIRKDLENMDEIQKNTWGAVKNLAPKLGLGIVGTNDYHYSKQADAEAQDALICIQTGKFLTDLERLRMIDTPNLYLKSPQEMFEAFPGLPQALANTVKIAKSVDLEIPLGEAKFPIFQLEDESSMQYLRRLTYERAEKKMEVTQEIKDRIEYELGVIEKKKYADYFLVVSDFIEWAHSEGIITNTRGSAAGSMVLYCLGVTNLNPLDYLLPFERFLTVYRPTLPDIDADVADDRRDEVIRYVMKRYGEDRVAHIVTFGTMMGRAAVRDIGRVMAIPYGQVDRIAKLIPPPHQGFHKPINEALKEVPELSEMYKNDPQVKKLLDLAMKIEGTVRHASVHAAGIVISPEEITHFTPLQRESDGDKVVSQYDMFAVESAGLVKMDILGIRNLSILGRAIEYVQANQAKEIDLDRIPLNDSKAFNLLARGETMGVFQLSSSGMTRYLVDLKPTSIADLAAMVALYRPGPLGVIPEYIDRKNNPRRIKYMDPRMQDYMKQSLGLFVYQEDVLYTAINIAGYSWEEADKFRKAMGKKIPSEMAKQKDRFVQGCIDNGLTMERAEEIFALIAPFAAYGFNKAHAASYAMVAYQTAYMKANFPVEFMTAVMTAEYGDTDKIAEAIEECRRMGIVILPPDINKSVVGFSIEELSTDELDRKIVEVEGRAKKQGIRFGLSAIKNVGISAIESILVAREEKPFKDLGDLCKRVDNRLVNRKTLESLIRAGALDKFGSRASQLSALDGCLEEAHKVSKSKSSGQVSLFGEEENLNSFSLPEIEEMPLEELLRAEKDLLGFYLHEPPYLKKLKEVGRFSDLRVNQISDENLNQKYTMGGVLLEIKRVLTKKNAQEMAFLTLFDGTGEIDCVIFPKTFASSKHFLEKEQVVVINGKLDNREDKFSLVVDSIELFDDYQQTRLIQASLEVEVPHGADGELLKKINSALREYPGDIPVSVLLPTRDSFRRMSLTFGVDPNEQMVKKLEELLGQGRIRLT